MSAGWWGPDVVDSRIHWWRNDGRRVCDPQNTTSYSGPKLEQGPLDLLCDLCATKVAVARLDIESDIVAFRRSIARRWLTEQKAVAAGRWRPWTDEELHAVESLRTQGASASSIAAVLGRTPKAVESLLTRRRASMGRAQVGLEGGDGAAVGGTGGRARAAGDDDGGGPQ